MDARMTVSLGDPDDERGGRGGKADVYEFRRRYVGLQILFPERDSDETPTPDSETWRVLRRLAEGQHVEVPKLRAARGHLLGTLASQAALREPAGWEEMSEDHAEVLAEATREAYRLANESVLPALNVLLTLADAAEASIAEMRAKLAREWA